VRLILTEFFAQLKKAKRLYARFLQVSATSYAADDSLIALEDVPGDRVMVSGLWPARSPDLTHDTFINGAI
jgi:hypothetical protein